MTALPPEDGRPEPSHVLQPRPPSPRSVLAAPLSDPHERARIGIPTGDNETIPIVIELNLGHRDGVAGAYQAFDEIWCERMCDPTPEPFEEYLRVLLTMKQVRALARDDQARPAPDRAIQQIWPDFPADILDVLAAEPDQDR